jgi:GNAT superfamily N-acetyltransferase
MTVDSVEAFRRDMLSSRGLDPTITAESGMTVVPEEARVGSRVASGYVYGRHFVIFTDPASADRLADFDPGSFEADSLDPVERFGEFATSAGAEILGRGAMRVLQAGAPTPVDGVAIVDAEIDADVARIQALVDACTEDEVDDAAIEMDELDPVIRCIEASPGGALIGYASAFPDEDFGGRWDIGVLTHPDHRRKGLGVRSVQCLVADLVADGQLPLYRHDLDNAGSAALATSLGFVTATRLIAARFPEAS